MWFDDEEVTGRRLPVYRRRRATVLNVQARGGGRRKSSPPRLTIWILVPALIAGAVYGGYLGLGAAGRWLFSENPRFTIRNVVVHGGTPGAQGRVREYARIVAGMNIFAFDAQSTRTAILRQAPRFKSMDVSRQLPDTVRIDIVERVPLARVDLGRYGVFVADAEGVVFLPESSSRGLPAILGYSAPGLQPGHVMTGMGAAALQVVAACQDAGIGVRVDTIKVTRDCGVLNARGAGWTCEVPFTWAGMGERTESSRGSLRDKLIGLRKTKESAAGRQAAYLDGTFGEYFVSPTNNLSRGV